MLMIIRGTSLNDALCGTWDDDVILGFEGDDSIYGNYGADQIDGGPGRDVAHYHAGAGVTIDLRDTGPQSGGQAEGDVLISIEDISGTRFDDTLIGTAASNHFWADTGNDTLIGGAGDDFFECEGGGDVLDGGEGMDSFKTVLPGYQAPHRVIVDLKEGMILYRGVETPATNFERVDVQTAVYGSDTIIGGDGEVNGVGDVIVTNEGEDFIDAGGGADMIRVFDGRDTILAGDGDDTVYGYGDSTIDAGAGDDFVRAFGSYTTRTTVVDGGAGIDHLDAQLGGGRDLQFNFAAGTVSENFEFANFEKLTLHSSFGNDTLVGGSLGDDIDSAAGNDSIQGLDGDDHLSAGDGDDVVRGGAGDDDLAGGAGNDTLAGYTGDDVLAGGAGQDVFEFWGVRIGHDQVADFNASEGDLLRLVGSGLRDFADVESHLQQTSDGALIQWQDGSGLKHDVLLLGIDATSLTASDFQFA
jgi:Ca2+-binding RTX toxin-like protein